MHHLARRTSLVGRQPEAQRREEEEGGEEEREDERGNGSRTTDGN